MKDRQFTVVLALVVAAGLVMGLIAFRMTSGNPAPGAIASANIAAPSNAPRPSAADEEVADQPADVASPSTDSASSQNGEPAPTKADPPEMQGPANGDPPGTAAAEPSRTAGPTASSESTPQ